MEQTPSHEKHNPELLQLIPPSARSIIEIGCSSGALAREYKKINPKCHYLGIDINPDYTTQASRYCDAVIAADLETLPNTFYHDNQHRDVWIFGDTLEHFKDPWLILRKIRAAIPPSGHIVACIPNAQHWSVLARLSTGDFHYEDSGLLDKTHLRWFTRKTIIQLFGDTGFKITEGVPRIFHQEGHEEIIQLIGDIAEAMRSNPEEAMSDALALQYVIQAQPA